MTDVREYNSRGSRADKRPLKAAHNEAGPRSSAEGRALAGRGRGRAWGTLEVDCAQGCPLEPKA